MPSVVEASEEFLLGSSIEKCWTIFEDLSNIGSCIPGCESIIPKDKTSANFKVKLKLGYISRTFELQARLTQIDRPSRISFIAEGRDALINGNLQFSEEPSEQTKVKYNVTIKATSVMAKTALNMVGKDLVRKQAAEFAACVKSKAENQTA